METAMGLLRQAPQLPPQLIPFGDVALGTQSAIRLVPVAVPPMICLGAHAQGSAVTSQLLGGVCRAGGGSVILAGSSW